MAQTRLGSQNVSASLERRRLREALITFGIVVGTVLLVVGLIVLYVWLSWQRVYWADQVTESRIQLEQLTIEQQNLEADVATYFSIERISRFAKQQGMVEPDLKYWSPQP